jgi:hypothetical protein
MIPFAVTNRVRLIFVNQRDYPGSTPLLDAELAELGSSDLKTRAKALAQQGLDIGLFLAWLIREANIPPVVIDQDGKQQGGIARSHPSSGFPRSRLLAPDRRPQNSRFLFP